MRRAAGTAAMALAVALAAAPARAEIPAAVALEPAADLAVVGVALAGALATSLIPVDASARWSSEWFGFDQPLRGQFSQSAHGLSNGLLLADLALPIAAHTALGADDELAKAVAVYGEALAVSLVFNSVIKRLVQRPRPYVYSDQPSIVAYRDQAGDDSHLSFYSGHSAMAFTAAVAGSYGFALRSSDTAARAAFWGVELALAAATADLRTRAGRHFYSDVLIGAVAGAAIGLAIPMLHQVDGADATPRPAEWAAMAAGLVGGVLFAELLPLDAELPTLALAAGRHGEQETFEVRLVF